MPGNRKNFSYFDYLDDNGAHWQVRGEDSGALSAIDGHATDHTQPAFGKVTRLRHPRYAEFTDAATFRKVRGVIYTPTAFAAISPGDTITPAQAPGSATTITYTLSAKIPERMPLPATSRHLSD